MKCIDKFWTRWRKIFLLFNSKFCFFDLNIKSSETALNFLEKQSKATLLKSHFGMGVLL